MAKKRFTFAMAKEKIKELEAALEDAKLNQDDNIYDAGEQKWIRFYKLGFLSLLAFNLTQLFLFIF